MVAFDPYAFEAKEECRHLIRQAFCWPPGSVASVGILLQARARKIIPRAGGRFSVEKVPKISQGLRPVPPAPLFTELWVCVVGCSEAYVVMGVRRSKFVPTSLSGEVREGLGIGLGGSWEGSGRSWSVFGASWPESC